MDDKNLKKKTTVKKTSTKASSTNKATTQKKTVTKKATPKKAPTKKVVSSKTVAKKPSVKKVTPKKDESKKTSSTVKKSGVKKIASVKTVVEPKIVEPKMVEIEPVEQVVSASIEKELKPIEKRKVPFKNYFIALAIILVIALLSIFGYQVYKNYQKQLWEDGYFYSKKENVNEIKYNELNSKLANLKGTTFILINYLGNEQTYNLEKEVYSLMKDYKLKEQFYYVNFSKEKKSNETIESEINSILKTNLVHNLPVVLYLKDGVLVDLAIREDNQVLESADVAKILDIYEFRK